MLRARTEERDPRSDLTSVQAGSHHEERISMNAGITLLLALNIGIAAGLRSQITPSVVAWAAHLGWISLHGSPLAFMGTKWAVGLFTVLALLELVVDQL